MSPMLRAPLSEPPCEAVATALGRALSHEELSAVELAHAEGCERCGPILARQHQAALIIARARRALEMARPDLDAAAWERVRSAVEGTRPAMASASSRWRDLWGGAGAWFIGGAAVGLALVILLLKAPAGEPASEGEVVDIAGGVAGPGVPAEDLRLALESAAGSEPTQAGFEAEPAGPVRTAPVLDGGFEVSLEAGAEVDGGETGRNLVVFDRHTVALAPHGLLRVVRLSETGSAFELVLGEASFEVKRAAGEAPLRVAAGDIAVEVRGTVFSVERRDGGVTVSVERGKVAVMRQDEDEVEVTSGERVVFPALAEDAPEVGAREIVKKKPVKRPQPERMVEVEVGHAAMGAESEAPDVSNLMPAILGAVRADRCVQALNALDRVSRAVDGKLPRAGLWLTAYCQRRLGNLERSRVLFQRYGTAGPWAVPKGDELPPLP